jgi:hypothetical protein
MRKLWRGETSAYLLSLIALTLALLAVYLFTPDRQHPKERRHLVERDSSGRITTLSSPT